MALEPRVRMGPPPRSFAADAHACIMVQVPRGSTEYKVAARWRRPIASSPQIVTPSPGKGKEIDVELDTASPIQVRFRGGRSGRDALGRAYERLLPLLARSLPPSPQATLAKGAHHDGPASQSSPSSRRSAGGHLRSCLVRSAG